MPTPATCAAGTLRQLDASITKERHLSFFVFNIQDIQGKELKTHAEAYDYLKHCGVTVIAHYYVCTTREEIWNAIEAIGDMRGTLPYDIDGAVIKVNNLMLRSQLRDTAKNAGYQGGVISIRQSRRKRFCGRLSSPWAERGRLRRRPSLTRFVCVGPQCLAVLCTTRISSTTWRSVWGPPFGLRSLER